MSATHVVCKCGSDRFSPWTVIRTKGKTATWDTEWRCDNCGRKAQASP